ncbi:MAG TPA: DNA repair protein RecO [Gemmatimonas sp.]|uniref:DNA repair protein RecO n=1 Tax=Gemmatimonas sp. TaxID=1962908 RepID=UPI002ED91007
MTVLATDAIVLHVADYMESSRILRLATREAGVQSVVARGARSSRKRFGAAVDLFAEGQAQVQLKPGRDLHTLIGFDVTRARAGLALHLDRFAAASAIGEVALRLLHDEPAPGVYDLLSATFDQLAGVEPGQATSTALGGLWMLVAEVGFRPTLDECAECHAPLEPGTAYRFHHRAGGALCDRCSRLHPGGRLLPVEARDTVRLWLDNRVPTVADNAARAHQRLLREFLTEHLPDGRPLRAYHTWEGGIS